LGVAYGIDELVEANEKEVINKFNEYAKSNFEGLFLKHPNPGPIISNLAKEWKAISSTPSQSDQPDDKTRLDPYEVENYLASSDVLGKLRIGLGDAPFRGVKEGGIWPGLAYTKDGAVHPCKV
jgi:hypothetical protein